MASCPDQADYKVDGPDAPVATPLFLDLTTAGVGLLRALRNPSAFVLRHTCKRTGLTLLAPSSSALSLLKFLEEADLLALSEDGLRSCTYPIQRYELPRGPWPLGPPEPTPRPSQGHGHRIWKGTFSTRADAPHLRTYTQPAQLFATGEQHAAHTQPALRTDLMASACRLLHRSRRVIPDLTRAYGGGLPSTKSTPKAA